MSRATSVNEDWPVSRGGCQARPVLRRAERRVDPELGRIEVFRLKEGGYDQGLLFDRSATLSSPSFPEIVVPLAPLFAPL